MSLPTRSEAMGESMESCGLAWNESSAFARSEWAIKSDAPPISIRLMVLLRWEALPQVSKDQLYEVWAESERADYDYDHYNTIRHDL